MDGNKKIINRILVLLSIMLAIYSCNVYKPISIALYVEDNIDSTFVATEKSKKVINKAQNDTVRIVKYIVIKESSNDSISLPDLNAEKQFVVKNEKITTELKPQTQKNIQVDIKNVADSIKPDKSLVLNTKSEKKVVLSAKDNTISNTVQVSKKNVIDSTRTTKTIKDTAKITVSQLNSVMPFVKSDSSRVINLDTIQKLQQQVEKLKTSNKLLADSITRTSILHNAKPKIAIKDQLIDSVQVINIDSIQKLNKQLETIRKTTKQLSDSISKIKSQPVVNTLNAELKLKSDSIGLLKKELELVRYSKPTATQTPVVQTITKIVTTPIINTDSILKLNKELAKIKRSNRQLSDSISKLKINNTLISTNTQLRSKTDSISLLKNELELIKQSKVVIKEVPVVVPNEKAVQLQNAKTDSIQSLKNKLKIVENKQQQVYDSINQKRTFLQEIFRKNASDKKLLDSKSDSIALLKYKSDSLNYLLKRKEIKPDNLQDDSLKIKIKINEEINKESQKIIQLKTDSILSLRKYIDELKKWNLEHANKLSDKILIQSDTLMLVAYYASGSLMPKRMNEILAELKNYLKTKNVVSVLLAGYTDISGSTTLNKRFTSKRLDLLRKKMISLGYSTKSIFVQNWGNTYASATVNELDRKVEIYVLVERMKV